ncbi:ribosome assembly cofactor RimP [Porphyromonas cangingivalis]|uniref:ribosome assembly cofactor RimP n=1 Tax=Porphyromonas cangingivalis TaxID=36874 RepID=UPI00051DAD03|nr:ribosome assembly cofactor RimP [Porphyromonas cangingivalis]KGL49295.1 hypothetical protein HQ34_03935 [Porphyromonas cangingivalis]
MIEVSKVREVVEEFVSTHEGFFIVHVEVASGNKVIVEIDHDDHGVDIDTCIALNRFIESKIDREVEDYELEVSSAGITTPLRSTRQYRKYVDKELEVLLTTGVKELGELKEVGEESIVLTVIRMVIPEGGRRKKPVEQDLTIAYKDIKKAVYNIRF